MIEFLRRAGLWVGIVLFLLGITMAAVPPQKYPMRIQRCLDSVPLVARADIFGTHSGEWGIDHPALAARLMVGRRTGYSYVPFDAALTAPATRGEVANVAYRIYLRLWFVGFGAATGLIGLLLICLSCCGGREEGCGCARCGCGGQGTPSGSDGERAASEGTTSYVATSLRATSRRPARHQASNLVAERGGPADPLVQPMRRTSSDTASEPEPVLVSDRPVPKPAATPVEELGDDYPDFAPEPPNQKTQVEGAWAWRLTVEIRQPGGRVETASAEGTAEVCGRATVGPRIEIFVDPLLPPEPRSGI